MNNVAWLMVQQKKTGAVATGGEGQPVWHPTRRPSSIRWRWPSARRTSCRRPSNEQKKAVALQPDVPGYRLNLAKLLIQSGDRTAARTELEKLQALGDKFAGQAEVASLMKTL